MSKVKLVLRKNNDLGHGELVELAVTVPDATLIAGVVRYDFETNEKGETRVSDDLAPVIEISNINYLTGQILTLVEGTISDPEQRKAAKDLFRNTIWGWYTAQMEGLSRAWRFDKGFEIDTPTK